MSSDVERALAHNVANGRWLLLYDVYVRAPARQQPVAAGRPAANVTFKI